MPDDPIAFPCLNTPRDSQPPDAPLVLPAYDPSVPMADRALTWPPGTVLRVLFLNGTDAWGQAVRAAIRERAKWWEDCANIRFSFVDSRPADIAINLAPGPGVGYGMYSCYLGTDCRAVIERGYPSTQLVFHPSMQSNPAFMKSEFDRVVPHELGHALAFIHEHMRPDRPIRWDVPALDRYCAGNFGWNARTVQQQIVDEYEPRAAGSLLGGAFDPESIMMYRYPAGLATYDDGGPFSTPNNTTLSPLDRVNAAMAYPMPAAAGGVEREATPGGPMLAGEIAEPGQVARFRFVAPVAGNYAVEARGDVLVSLLNRRGDPAGKMLAAEGPVARVEFHPLQVGATYYAEVRAAKPTSGTGPFTLGVAAPSTSTATTATSPDPMLAALNRARASAGRPALVASPAILRAAIDWAATMAAARRISHDGWGSRAAAVAPGRRAGEVVARGQPDAASVVAAWLASPPHRANILGPFDAVGWGAGQGPGGPYWCAIFADTGRGGAS